MQKFITILITFLIINSSCKDQNNNQQATSNDFSMSNNEIKLAKEHFSVILSQCTSDQYENDLYIKDVQDSVPNFQEEDWNTLLYFIFSSVRDDGFGWNIRPEFKKFLKTKGFESIKGGDSWCHSTCTKVFMEGPKKYLNLHLWFNPTITRGKLIEFYYKKE